MAFYVIHAVVLIVALWSRGGLAEIQVNPSNLALSGGGTGSVDVICRLPSATTATSVSLIRISRNTALQPSVNQGLAVANAYSATNQGKAVLSSGGLSSNVATVLGSTSEKSVTLTMKQVDCQYAGVYYCTLTYITGTEDYPVTHVPEDAQNLTVTTPPSNITTSVSPDYESYKANDTVELLCNAAIGSYEPGKEQKPVWTWEYYETQIAAWQQYNPESGIRTEDPVPAGNCIYRQTSYLQLVLSTEDSQRQYRCTVQRTSGRASAIITLGVVNAEETISPTTVATTSIGGDSLFLGGRCSILVLIEALPGGHTASTSKICEGSLHTFYLPVILIQSHHH